MKNFQDFINKKVQEELKKLGEEYEGEIRETITNAVDSNHEALFEKMAITFGLKYGDLSPVDADELIEAENMLINIMVKWVVDNSETSNLLEGMLWKK